MESWVNFINNLQAAFTKVPQAQKDTTDLTVFFAHLGSECKKALRKKLMKLTPGLNFINVLCAQIPNAQKDSQVVNLF